MQNWIRKIIDRIEPDREDWIAGGAIIVWILLTVVLPAAALLWLGWWGVNWLIGQ